MRALRVGKLTIAALEATLRLQFNEMDLISDEINLTEELPMLQRYTRSIEELRDIAEQLAADLAEIFDGRITVTIENSLAQIGSGSLPVETLPSFAVVLESPNISAEALATQFRTQAIPVIGRTQDGRFWIDVRTVYDKEVDSIIEAAKGIESH
jgi:L-seryl-tRNA(Ser) seleniumtransferase